MEDRREYPGWYSSVTEKIAHPPDLFVMKPCCRGALLAFLTVGSITWTMMQCLGEMTVFAPISGGYVHQVDR